jgi:hypothetical protein
MKLSRLSSAGPLGLCLAALFLAGCATSSEQVGAIGVSSPPPPIIGSTPIAAYDDYARAIAPPTKIRIEAVAQSGTR